MNIQKKIVDKIRDWKDLNWSRNPPCPIFVDVDETLIFWKDELSTHKCPWKANWDLVRLLKHLGNLANVEITVWSQGGAEHCEEIVRELGLTKVVKRCIDKPFIAIDDIPFTTAFSSNFDPNTKKD